MADAPQSGFAPFIHGCVLTCCALALLAASATSQTTTVFVLPERTSQPRQGDAVTLRCEVLGFRSGTHFLSWVAVFPDEAKILTWMGELDSRVSGAGYAVVNEATADPSAQPEVHSVVIDPVSRSDDGMYTCRVLEVLQGSSFFVVSSARTALTVYPAGIFPSCSPVGAASVPEGSSLSCAVAANTSELAVTRDGSPEVWASSPLGAGPGSRLTAAVAAADSGATFNCSSVVADFPGVTLDCQIGPLSVIASPTATAPSPTLSSDHTESSTTSPPAAAAVATGAAVAIILVAVLAIVVVAGVVAWILHRRRGRLRPSVKGHDGPAPTGAPSPSPPEQPPAANGRATPAKPAPYAPQGRRDPSSQPPVVYASVQPGRGKVAPQDPAEGGTYATVRAEDESPGQRGAEPVSYAAVYQRHRPRASDPVSPEDGLVYAELDLVNPPDSDNRKPIPKEEPTVYAELANLK